MYPYTSKVPFASLLGLTLQTITGMTEDSQEVHLVTTCNRTFTLQHIQDCCELVRLYEVVGDVNDLLDEPLLVAEEVSSEDSGFVPPEDLDVVDDPDCTKWTFYRLATRKGYVVLRWLGESNGYYCMAVSLHERAGRLQ